MKRPTKEYWREYYGHRSDSIESIRAVCGRYDKYWELLVRASKKAQSILEIGAFPGRYLSYVASRYKLLPTGIDFNPDGEKVADIMSIMGVEKYSYITTDFLDFATEKRFDVIISLGFIEHFEDFNSIVKRHCELLAPGGSMMILVPNKLKLRYVFGLMFDYENLQVHNLECMTKKAFRKFAIDNNLEIVSLEYFGGFEFRVHSNLGRLKGVFYRALCIVFRRINPFLARHPNSLWSSVLLGIYRRTV